MCCIDDDYRKNGALAGLFGLGTSVASFYLIITFLLGTGPLALAGLMSFSSMAMLTSIMTLVCVIRMNEILRRDLALRRITKAFLVLSILTIPLPIYGLVMHMKRQDDHRYANQVIDDRSIPIYAEISLMAFYLLLCANIFCAVQGAAEERRYHEGEAKYQQVTKEEMHQRQLKSDAFLENHLISGNDDYMELSSNRDDSFIPSLADDEMSVYENPEAKKKEKLPKRPTAQLPSPQNSEKSRASTRGRGRRGQMRSMKHSLHRSDFSLTTDDGQYGLVELELGASDDEVHSLAYSVYSHGHPKKQMNFAIPVAGEDLTAAKTRTKKIPRKGRASPSDCQSPSD